MFQIQKHLTTAIDLHFRSTESTKLQLSSVVSPTESAFSREITTSLHGLEHSFGREKSELLLLFGLNGIVQTICQKLRVSSILGFILSGIALGPYGLNAFRLHTVDQLGELGILMFLFEMGLELSVGKLSSMKYDVFGLGTLQFLLTTAVFGMLSTLFGCSPAACITIGFSLALSSSAFVVQLLKDKKCMEAEHAKTSLGILLFQDLAVVPLLVIVQLLASTSGSKLSTALGFAAMKFIVMVSIIALIGATIFEEFVSLVMKTESQEAIIATIATATVAVASATHGVGLSESLGAFTTGITLSASPHRHHIEKLISPLRSLLLSLFFVRVGCAINTAFVVKEFKTLLLMLVGLVGIKALITSAICHLFGKKRDVSQKCGLLTSQGGEFAFVALGIAENFKLLDSHITQLLMTTVALSMGITPLLADIVDKIGIQKKTME